METHRLLPCAPIWLWAISVIRTHQVKFGANILRRAGHCKTNSVQYLSPDRRDEDGTSAKTGASNYSDIAGVRRPDKHGRDGAARIEVEQGSDTPLTRIPTTGSGWMVPRRLPILANQCNQDACINVMLASLDSYGYSAIGLRTHRSASNPAAPTRYTARHVPFAPFENSASLCSSVAFTMFLPADAWKRPKGPWRIYENRP